MWAIPSCCTAATLSLTQTDVYKRQEEGRKKLADEIRLAYDARQWVEAIQEYACLLYTSPVLPVLILCLIVNLLAVPVL